MFRLIKAVDVSVLVQRGRIVGLLTALIREVSCFKRERRVVQRVKERLNEDLPREGFGVTPVDGISFPKDAG